MTTPICKFYIDGKCKNGSSCKFLHNNIKKKYKKLVKVNTETFEPWYDVPDMRVIIATPNIKLSESDLFLLPGLFDQNDNDIYYKLLDEIDNSNVKNIDELWKSWHGGTHLIADDHLNWKNSCPTFNMIIDKIAEYFNMNVKATRLNLYEDLRDYKSMHFDAAAIDSKKAEIQNVTIGVSFGCTRDIQFQHAENRARISFPIPNGMIYGFGKQVNIDWRHGIPPIKPEVINDLEKNILNDLEKNILNTGRISIILWGWIDQNKL